MQIALELFIFDKSDVCPQCSATQSTILVMSCCGSINTNTVSFSLVAWSNKEEETRGYGLKQR